MKIVLLTNAPIPALVSGADFCSGADCVYKRGRALAARAMSLLKDVIFILVGVVNPHGDSLIIVCEISK